MSQAAESTNSFSFSRVNRIAGKELASYFNSPVAFIFLATFLFSILFIFFWIERFFARNIADARPLFEWMPLMLIFLVAALTMRMWSEERRMGTVEFLMTLPISTAELVFGKFLSCLGLVALALILTIPIPITVSMVGNLDWGPVIGAYIATLLLAGSYSAIGLYVSAKTESQIVSLIGTVIICFSLYFLGNDSFTAFFGNFGSEVLKLIAPSSRFESITRGVIDLRDMYYYASVMGVFLALNIFSLERLRWQASQAVTEQSTNWKLLTIFLALNLLVANFWLHRVNGARLDITEGKIYSISETTENFLSQLQEPLLIRGYFSDRTHPLLAPLVPRMRDLLKEYEIAGKGKVRVEVIDPKEFEDLEEEANRKYGIRPVPFQINDKYQVSVASSYFDILLEYGDKYEVLGFRDLIDVKAVGEGDVDVRLRNPEYDLTRSVKKVLYGFQGIDHLFASLQQPVEFITIASGDSELPAQLVDFKSLIQAKVNDLAKEADGKLVSKVLSPDSPEAKERIEAYGIQPVIASLVNPQPFYYTMLLESSSGDEAPVQLAIPADLSPDTFVRNLESGLKRFSRGFLRTVGIVTPPAPPQNPMMQQFGMGAQGGKQFNLLRTKLQETYQLQDLQLDSGEISDNIDMLLVLAPKELSEKAQFAIDQFLMKGRTVFLATSPFDVSRTNAALRAAEQSSGLKDWLGHYGLSLGDKFVLDTQNESFAVPIQRKINGFTIQDLAVVRYPYFLDVRASGMNEDVSLFAGLESVTINWPTELSYEAPEGSSLSFTKLLTSSSDAWLSDSTDIALNSQVDPRIAFAPQGDRKERLLGAMLEGSFRSYFAGKENPLLADTAPQPSSEEGENKEEDKSVYSSVVEKSPSSARLIMVSSSEFLTDSVLQMSAGINSSKFVNSLQLVENSIDWSLEDRGLLSIRSRGQFARTLESITEDVQKRYEYINYLCALLGLLIIFGFYRQFVSRATVRRYESAIA